MTRGRGDLKKREKTYLSKGVVGGRKIITIVVVVVMIGMVVNEVTGPSGMKDLTSVLGSHDQEKEKILTGEWRRQHLTSDNERGWQTDEIHKVHKRMLRHGTRGS